MALPLSKQDGSKNSSSYNITNRFFLKIVFFLGASLPYMELGSPIMTTHIHHYCDACCEPLKPDPCELLLLFDNIKVKMARKPGKKQKENPVGCTGEGKR